MPATYERGGLQFVYPENWKLVDDDYASIPRTICVQSPTAAFWSVDIHPFSIDPQELLDQLVASMQKEYNELEIQRVSETVEDHKTVGCDLSFVCLDFVVHSRIRTFRSGHATFAIMSQAEDREFDRLANVFQAITVSLLRDEASPNS